MALTTGDRLGPYEIVGLTGHGAMGEVYRARDTRLGRQVALKVLPVAFANDPHRLSRLEREARVISHVSHPNICTLYDIFEEQGAPVLVFELIEGETLQQRLLRGPIPLRETLHCAAAIAAALEAAHRKGIVHRDLKPSNIKMTSGGTIKVLDFGIAKIARESPVDDDAPDVTLTLGGTKERVLVGTVAYVSPEQAMGDRVDQRSDIWAFGCLVYEMLTAKRAFPGVAVADTLGAVMRGEPDWAALPADCPPELRTLLRRCLEKERAKRLADIGDARLEIDDLLAGRVDPASSIASRAEPAPARSHRKRSMVTVAFVAGAIFATVMARFAFDGPADAEPPPAEMSAASVPSSESSRELPPTPTLPLSNDERLSQAEITSSASGGPQFVQLPADVRWARTVDGGVPNTILAISADGRLVVFSGRTEDDRALWLYSFSAEETWRLPGTDGAISPFWSPDGASIGFFADRRLKRLDLNGLGTRSTDVTRIGGAVELCEVGSQRGGTWGPDNTIVFAPFPGGLKRISGSGGPVASLTSLDSGEPHHVRPQFFAGTNRLLYRVSSGDGRKNEYYATSLDSRGKKLIGRFDSGNVVYAQGHLLFVQDSVLMAQPFDVNNLTTTGPARPVASGVLLSSGSRPIFGVFSASQTGRVVHLSAGGDFNNPMTVITNWTKRPVP